MAVEEIQLQSLDFGDVGLELKDLNLNFFDVSGKQKYSEETRYLKPKVYVKPKGFYAYENAVKLARELRLDFGERADVVVNGSFIFGDFIEAYLIAQKAVCKRMIVSTLSLSENNVDSFHNLMAKGWIERLDLVISHYFYSHERYKLIPYVYKRLDIDDKFQMAVAFVHTKVIAFETRGGRKIVIHGSANLRSSGNVEAFTIEENPELYDFYVGIYDGIIERYATVNKVSNRRELWQEIGGEKSNKKKSVNAMSNQAGNGHTGSGGSGGSAASNRYDDMPFAAPSGGGDVPF